MDLVEYDFNSISIYERPLAKMLPVLTNAWLRYMRIVALTAMLFELLLEAGYA
jgi:hypothetical protein